MTAHMKTMNGMKREHGYWVTQQVPKPYGKDIKFSSNIVLIA